MSGPEDHSEIDAVARLTLLARAGEILSSVGDRTLERLAGLLTSGFASCCAIDVLDDDGALARMAVAPGREFPLAPGAPRGPEIVLRTGEPQLIRAIDLDRLGRASCVCVPLLARERPSGAITVLSTCRTFGAADVELMSELARRAAMAIETARLVRSLERSEERYRQLFERSPLPMWVYDAETLDFLAVNESATRHYGYSRADFMAMRITDIRPLEDVELLLTNLRERGGPGSIEPGVWRHRLKDGRLIDVEITAGRVVFGGRDAALVVANDVTDRRILQERLAQAEKMEAIGRLAGGVAHDFNNLLTVISGYASVLLAEPELGRRAELEEVARAAEQASSLTRQLLAFSRRQVLHPRVLDLNEIVAGMEPMVGRLIGDDVMVGVRLEPELAMVEADRAELERVIMNLAANARDAMPEGGRLTIETANVELGEDHVREHGDGTAGPNVMLAVSDTGIGMTEDVRRHLFEPFFTTKGPGAGTGLGLATVFGVVKQSGGSIFVYSEPGRGTTFKIYLPAASAPSPSAGAAPAAGDDTAERGTETIMLVEDNEGVRELVRLLLEERGYEVLVPSGAAEAEELCSERPDGVDLLLTDVVMPEVNGRDLAERLARVSPSMRVLFMSGYSDEAVYSHGVISPDAAFLEKPFTDRTLALKVREVLDG